MSNTIQPSKRQTWTDERMEMLVGNLLRFGVLTSAAVAILGGIPFLIAHWSDTIHYGMFEGQPAELTSVHGILQGALQLQSTAVIQLGLLLLLGTPIARVALSLLAFAKQHDRTYVVVTMIVLGVLIWSLTGGVT